MKSGRGEKVKEKKWIRKAWVTRYSKKAERIFFFYATIVMFLIYGLMKLFNGS